MEKQLLAVLAGPFQSLFSKAFDIELKHSASEDTIATDASDTSGSSLENIVLVDEQGPCLYAPQPADLSESSNNESPRRLSSSKRRRPRSSRRSRRRVRFGADDSEDSLSVEVLGPLLVPASEMKKSQRRKIWWKKDEILRNVKEAAKEQKIDSKDQRISAAVAKTFLKCVDGDENALKDVDRENIAVWTGHKESKRGLERFVIPEFGKQRSLERVSSIAAVLRVQKILRNQGSKENNAAYLRSVSIHFTKSARLFALLMAEADAKALEQDEDHNKEEGRDDDDEEECEVNNSRVFSSSPTRVEVSNLARSSCA